MASSPIIRLDSPIAAATWAALGFPKGWGSFNPEILPTVQFVVPLPNGVPAEAFIAERVASPGFVAQHNLGAVAAQNSFFRLVNAAASPVNLYIDQIRWGRSAALTGLPFTLRTGAAAGIAVGSIANKQLGGAGSAGASTFGGASAAVGGTVLGYFSAEPGGVDFVDPIIVPPNADLSLVQQTVNTDFSCAVFFREVPV